MKDQSRKEIIKLEAQLKKLDTNYKGMVAREERYLSEIEALKNKVEKQKKELYRTYSYRLGYLLIHSTKSFKNFVTLPSELIKLYLDNRSRKKELRILSNNDSKSATKNDVSSLIIRKELQENFIPSVVKELKIATVMDEFTSLCFAPEAKTLQISPNNFKQELKDFKPDFLFIESAWQGKDGLWKLKVSQQGDELLELIQYCKQHNIKTLFWNKEDPVHFGTFIETAKLMDVVFTTDIDCIQRYKEILQHDEVYLLPFAAQPKIHNPIELYEREDKFNFAGSYYLKYPVRQRDFAVLSEVALETKGLDIYDRNFNNDHPHYQFPDRYHPLILGALPPEEIDKAYKGYEFGINMNTIKQSQTMFARRVFEMLASNTIVLSNYSRGVRLLFGDLVICSDNKNELKRQLTNVLASEIKYKKFKLEGVRKVLKEHTYEHRLAYILSKLKINTASTQQTQQVLVIANCTTEEEITQVIKNFSQQNVKEKTLCIVSKLKTKNPHAKENIVFVKDLSDLQKQIEEANYSYITIFNQNDYYGQEYLSDLLLSYGYLQYYEFLPVTKDAYFEFEKTLQNKKGKEYQFVQSCFPTRTLFTKEFFRELIQNKSLSNLLADKKISCKAFSIDSLSYIKNGMDASQKEKELICSPLIVDAGVDLHKHLLPIAESITFKAASAPEVMELHLDSEVIKQSLRKEITLKTASADITLNSTLPNELHRLITISNPFLLKERHTIKLEASFTYNGDVLFVLEFLDAKQKQISHTTVAPAEVMAFEIPPKAIYARANIRIKGQGNVTTNKQIKLTFYDTATPSQEDSYPNHDLTEFDKDAINAQLVRPKSKQIRINNTRSGLEISSTLPESKHAYIYFKEIFKREEINLLLNSVFKTVADVSGFDLRSVFIFLDKNKEKLAHSIIKVDNFSHAMAIPEACVYVQIGFKITGSGKANLHSLTIGEIKERVNTFVGKSDTLVLAKQYPAYDDLYKYGFLHSRLRAYKNSGVITDMFKISGAKGNFGFSEFETIDVFTGDSENLRKTLQSGQFKQVFIHILDRNMWDILEEFIDEIKMFVWVHGSEAQVWQRRAYEFKNMSSEEINRRKRLSDQRKQFWQRLIKNKHENLELIFVSEYFKNEFVTDICDGEENFNYKIIHNYIDNKIFPYKEKKAEDAYKILSIRPFSSLTYANDLTVKTILELSKTPQFKKFQFTIVGDGELFDKTVAPIRNFQNVTLRKEFLTQTQIANLHHKHGIFLVPTRMDTQGVSRGEAMSSGLVAATTDVAAVSEFISPNEGIIVKAEDYKELANQILLLANNPEIFKKFSNNGSKRVIKQCNIHNTIYKELNL